MNVSENAFSFVDAGRTFTCEAKEIRPRSGDVWWWFVVSTERDARHAPFRADADDTQPHVQARIVAFYDELLARRAAPVQPRWQKRTPTS